MLLSSIFFQAFGPLRLSNFLLTLLIPLWVPLSSLLFEACYLFQIISSVGLFFKHIISMSFQVWNIVQALSFKPKTYFKIVLSSPRPFSSPLFKFENIVQALSFKHKTYFKIILSSPLFQVWNIVQALSLKPKTYFKIVLPNPRPFSRFLLQAQDIFEDRSFKPKTYSKLPLSSPFFQVLSCSSFAFTSSFTHAQKIRDANSKLTSKLVHF